MITTSEASSPQVIQAIHAVVNNEFAVPNRRNLHSYPFKLNDAFIEKYMGKEPAWGELGWFTFKRTYARRVENKNGESFRTEEWTEVVRRVVEGNLSIIPNDPIVTQDYGQKLFNLIWNLVFTPPGRGLWVSGTDFAKRTGDALVNCWYINSVPHKYGYSTKVFSRISIDPEKAYVSYPFCFLFDMSMKGGGVGFSAEQNDVDLIPKVESKVTIHFYIDKHHKDYNELRNKAHELGASLNSIRIEDEDETSAKTLLVADSREGWAESLAFIIDEHFEKPSWKPQELHIDFSEVRPRGTHIRGFGGVASGSAPLMELLHFTNNLLNRRVGKKLTTTDVTDMFNSIGRAVVAGNVRRTAEIAIGSADDQNFINLKNWTLYDRDELSEEERYQKWAQGNHRWASNNSIVIDDPRSFDFSHITPAIIANGEPGLLNRYLMRNYGRIIDGYKHLCDDCSGANPCGEISLKSNEPCNLVELMVPVMFEKDYDASEVIPYMVHWAKRVTFANYEWEESHKVITDNRRIGVSLTGLADWFLLRFSGEPIVGWTIYDKLYWHDMIWNEPQERRIVMKRTTSHLDYNYLTEIAEPIYHPELIKELNRMYEVTVEADRQYSKELSNALGYQVNPSIKLTTNKPSGTVALLPGVSPGIHYHYFSHGIRRIQVQSNDPLLKLAEMCGLHTEVSAYSPGSHCIEFPVKVRSADVPGFRSADELTIEEQFALQALMNIYWADNMVSCTVYFKQDEAPKIAGLLEQYRMRIKSTSLLPYSGHGYVQAPYEPVDKQTWQARKAKCSWKPEELYHILVGSGQLHDREMSLTEALECAGSACPVR